MAISFFDDYLAETVFIDNVRYPAIKSINSKQQNIIIDTFFFFSFSPFINLHIIFLVLLTRITTYRDENHDIVTIFILINIVKLLI